MRTKVGLPFNHLLLICFDHSLRRPPTARLRPAVNSLERFHTVVVIGVLVTLNLQVFFQVPLSETRVVVRADLRADVTLIGLGDPALQQRLVLACGVLWVRCREERTQTPTTIILQAALNVPTCLLDRRKHIVT